MDLWSCQQKVTWNPGQQHWDFSTQAIRHPGCTCSSFWQWHHCHAPLWLPEMDLSLWLRPQPHGCSWHCPQFASLSKDTLKDIPFNYHSTLRLTLIIIEDNLLIYREPIAGCMSYTKLILVPSSLYSILFIAFHPNALGSHFDAYRTLHYLHLCYFWPDMHSYCSLQRD